MAHHILDLKKGCPEELKIVNEDNAKKIENSPFVWAMVESSKTYAIVGFTEINIGEWEASIIIDPSAGEKLLSITKLGIDILNNFPHSRIQVSIEVTNKKVQRFDTNTLGFKLAKENIKRHGDGKDYNLYIREKGSS